MLPFDGDIKELEKSLKLATPCQRDEILKEVENTDLDLAETMRIKYVNIEDLKYLDGTEYLKILQGIDVFDLGMALRLGSKELREFVISNSPGAAKSDILSILDGPPQQKVNVMAATERILKVVRAKLEAKEISIDPEDQLV